MQAIRTLALISFVISCYYLTYYFYLGIANPIPAPGDSWDYHIPIAISILNGNFLTLSSTHLPHWYYPGTTMILTKIPQWYYPGSSEIFLSLFILLGIPMTLSNMLPILLLFFCCYKLARTFGTENYFSLLFASTFVSLTAILRWANAISIDVWTAVWFTLSIILLELPEKNIRYFAKLGFVFGMLIGSKYTAIYFLIILLVFYGKALLRYINFRRFVVLFLSFSFAGLFWYIRNYLLTGNPFYPLPLLGLNGPLVFNDTVLIETIRHPLEMYNAVFGEYKLWLFTLIIALILLIYKFFIQKKFELNNINKLFLLGLINFLCYLSFPTSEQSWIMVSSLRYSFPVFIPLILGTFLLASKYKKGELLGYLVLANMLPVLSMTYYPKLVLFYFPIALLIIYLLNKKSKPVSHRKAKA